MKKVKIILKNLSRWFLRQYHKMWDHDGALFVHAMKGKFRVKYSDGGVSQPFSWRVANEYAKMFKGKVIDNF